MRLKKKEKVDAGLARVARELFEKAGDALDADHDGGVETDTPEHRARKQIKKLRAWLRLVRPAWKKPARRAANAFLRDEARRLAAARDAQARVDCASQWRAHAAADARPMLDALLGRLQGHVPADAARADPAVRRDVAAALAARAEEISARVPRDWKDGDLRKRLKWARKRARKRMRRALASGAGEDFHEWRKRVKDHWYFTRMLRSRVSAAAEERKPLSKLSDLLGDEHDLTVLFAWLREHSALLEDLDADRVMRSWTARREALREEAAALGARLYAGAPAAT